MATLRPEAGAGDDQDRGVMGQAVQPGRGQQWITEQVGPLHWGTNAGQQHTAASVAIVET